MRFNDALYDHFVGNNIIIITPTPIAGHTQYRNLKCLLYDTTYEHETMNEHADQERVVLHVDFFNTLALTPLEVDVMKYIYELREEFMKVRFATIMVDVETTTDET